MANEKMLEEIRIAVQEGDGDEVIEKIEKALVDAEIDPLVLLEQGLSPGIQAAGELYSEGEYFLPDLVCSADAMKQGLEILQPRLDEMVDVDISKGKIVVATVAGDIHDIGKTIVASMLTAAGYQIIDLGCDVSNEVVIETIKREKPDIVGLSALLGTTMQEQGNIIEMLKEEGIRENVKVMIGGAPVTQIFADKISADGYSEDAISAVKLAGTLVTK